MPVASSLCTALLFSAMKNVECTPVAAFFGAMGAASALIFANLGAAYGTAKSGVGVAQLGIMAPLKIMRGIVPVVMAGILGIYGLIVAVCLMLLQ